MKKYSLLLSFVVIYASSMAGYADSSIDPKDLIKVTPANKTACAEYYTYKGELYCSKTAKSTEAPDAAILEQEYQKIQFDHRVWRAAWGKHTSTITTIEYVPGNDNIEHWNELITSQFIPTKSDISPKDYMNMMMQDLKKSGFNPIVTLIEDKPDEVIFEFRITEPENMQQDELQKIVKTDDGLYILHYVIKKADMGQKNRDEWIERLKNSTIEE